jgi:hypothetical protein
MRRANAEGLIGIVPFTYFKPGIWDLRCCADLMADVFGQSWQYSIQIQVIAPEINQQPGDIDSTNQLQELEQSSVEPIDSSFIFKMTNESAITLHSQIPTETEEDKIINQPVSPVWFKGETAEQILQNLIDLALPTSDTLLEQKKVDKVLPLPSAPPLKLHLDQDHYIAHWGETLTINGCVELPNTKVATEKFAGKTLSDLELIIELRSPWESKVLTQIQHSLTDQVLPLKFSSTVDIPIHCQSKLILADIKLYGTTADFAQVMLLAGHAFTITADVTELLAITTDQASSLEAFAASSAANKQPIAHGLGLELFNIAKTHSIEQFYQWKPASNKPLPPRIHAQELADSNGHSPQLPKLPLNQKKPVVDEVTQESVINTSQKTQPSVAIDLEKLVIKQRRTVKQPTTLPYLKKIQTKPTTENSIELPAIASTGRSTIASPQKKAEPPQNQPPAQVEVTNEVVKIEVTADSCVASDITPVTEELILPTPPTRELDNSQNFITSPLLRKWWESQGYFVPETLEVEEAEEVGEDFSVETSTDVDTSPETEVQAEIEPEIEIHAEAEAETEKNIFEEMQPAWLNQEIVIDDTAFELEITQYNAQALEMATQSAVDTQQVLLEALPIPQLSLPNGELVAGASVKVKVELPEVAAPVVVKLWVEDYQTRALLDGPHLLTDLLPNPLGGWEGTINLTVPFGCLEIRLEAIALNISTKQESHKVTIVKPVVPPDLPVVNPDEILGF